MSVEINLPFPGFYHSWLSSILEYEEESYAEHQVEGESEFPEPLQLDESDFSDALFTAMDYGESYKYLRVGYVDAFNEWAGEVLGESRTAWRKVYNWENKTQKSERYRENSIGAKFSIMTSPREYNFETDRLFVDVSAAFLKRLFKMSKADNHDTLRATIEGRFTSYDGFISSYSNSLSSWLETPLLEWDYNELGTLLIACLELEGDDSDLMENMIYTSELGYNALNAGLDYDKFDNTVLEKRAEKLSEWYDADPLAVAEYKANNETQFESIVASDPDLIFDLPDGDAIGAFYRCKESPDLFGAET